MKKLLVLIFILNLSFAQNNAEDYLQASPPSTGKVEISTKKTTIIEQQNKDGRVVELEKKEEVIPEEINSSNADERENLEEREKIKKAIKAAKENGDAKAVRELQKKLKNSR